MKVHEVSEPYKATTGAMVDMLRQYHGNEPSLPHKIAQIMFNLSNKEDVPLRLLIGPDAIEYVSRATEALAASDKKWHETSMAALE